MRPVVIIGGGLSGLSTGYFLSKANVPFVLFEASGHLGGIIRTEQTHGCVVELGPDGWVAAKPHLRELIKDLGLSSEIIPSNDHLRVTYVWKAGRLVPLPDGLSMMVPRRLGPILRSPLVGLGGKLKIWREQFKRPLERQDDVAISTFVEEHLGRDVLEYFAEPLLAGVFGGDITRLSTEAVLPKFLEWERRRGSLVRAAGNENERSDGPLFQSMKNGMQSVADALASKLGERIIRGKVEKVEKGWRVRVEGEWIDASQVVIACKPGEVLPDLFPPVEYSSCVVVPLIYDRKDISHPMNGFGFLVPKIERRALAACTWVNVKYAHRAPEDKVLIRCFLSSGNAEDAKRELVEKMGIRAKPLFECTVPYPLSMPQYTVGHKAKVNIAQEMLKDFPGLHLAGNTLHGVGMPDCVREAQAVAARIAHD